MSIHVKKWTLIGIISVLVGIGVVATPNVLADIDSGTRDQLQTTPLVRNPLLGSGYYDDQAENSIPQNQLMAPALFSNNGQFLMGYQAWCFGKLAKGCAAFSDCSPSDRGEWLGHLPVGDSS